MVVLYVVAVMFCAIAIVNMNMIKNIMGEKRAMLVAMFNSWAGRGTMLKDDGFNVNGFRPRAEWQAVNLSARGWDSSERMNYEVLLVGMRHKQTSCKRPPEGGM